MNEKIRIENTTLKVHGIGGVLGPDVLSLQPGINLVDRTAWTAALEQKMVQVHLEEGHFVELPDELAAPPPPSAPRASVSTITTASILDAAKPTPPVAETKAAPSETISPVAETKKPATETAAPAPSEKKHEKHSEKHGNRK